VWPSPSSTSRFGLCWGCSSAVAVASTSRTSSSWSCATSLRCCAGRSRVRGFAPRIVPCSRRRPATCHAPCALLVWSARGRCCAGIAGSSAGSGGSRPASADVRQRRPRCGPWCCGWLARIRAGAIVGSAVSWPNSASECRHRRSVACSPARDLARLRGGPVRVGASSYAPRRPASSPATSSPSRASSYAATTSSSSSRTQAAVSGSPAARRTPLEPG
jgi:hypothetical protein